MYFAAIRAALKAAPFFMIEKGEELTFGVCASCQKKTLRAPLEKPLHLNCSRSSCGSVAVQSLLPDCFTDLALSYPPTESQPRATVDAYLNLFYGFATQLVFNGESLYLKPDWYEQATYWTHECDKGTVSVRFYLNADKTAYFDHFLTEINLKKSTGTIKSKGEFTGDYKGLMWQPPSQEIIGGDVVFLTTTIIDAITFCEAGHKAIAIFNNKKLPEGLAAYYEKHIVFIFALNETLPIKWQIKNLRAKSTSYGGEYAHALSTAADLDMADCNWNQLFQRGKLTKKDIKNYRFTGDYVFAQSKKEKAFAVFCLNNESIKYFVIGYYKATYAVQLDKEKYTKELKGADPRQEYKHRQKRDAFYATAIFEQIADFRAEYLYSEKKIGSYEAGKYYFRFYLNNGAPPQETTMTHADFKNPTTFSDAARKVTGGLFYGEKKDVTYLYRHWFGNWKKEVAALDYIGYVKEFNGQRIDAYIYNDFAVMDGKVIEKNSKGYLELLNNASIKTNFKGDMRLNNADNWSLPQGFIDDFYKAYTIKGFVLMASLLGSLFAQQIREKHQSFPFTGVVGDSASGKSNVVEVLFKLIGKEFKPINPASLASSPKGLARVLDSLSNLPLVFNEAESENDKKRAHLRKFSYNPLKDLFEGNLGAVLANFSNNNDYRQFLFRGTLWIIQNIEVIADEHFKSRICGTYWNRDHHTPEGRYANDRLMSLKREELSGFLFKALKNEKQILAKFDDRFAYHNQQLMTTTEIKHQRVIKCHAQLMALADCLNLVIPIPIPIILKTRQEIIEMAHARNELLRDNHPLLEEFWEKFDYLNTRTEFDEDSYGDKHYKIKTNVFNHAKDPEKTIAINLPELEKIMFNIDFSELRHLLKTSVKPKYICHDKNVKDARINRQFTCWVFENNRAAKENLDV